MRQTEEVIIRETLKLRQKNRGLTQTWESGEAHNNGILPLIRRTETDGDIDTETDRDTQIVNQKS